MEGEQEAGGSMVSETELEKDRRNEVTEGENLGYRNGETRGRTRSDVKGKGGEGVWLEKIKMPTHHYVITRRVHSSTNAHT